MTHARSYRLHELVSMAANAGIIKAIVSLAYTPRTSKNGKWLHRAFTKNSGNRSSTMANNEIANNNSIRAKRIHKFGLSVAELSAMVKKL